MTKKNMWIAGLISLIALILNFQLALAHESVTVGNYEIEVGWVSEPPVAGEQNAIIVSVVDTRSGEAQPVEDVSSLTVTVSYGGQSKALALEPLGEDTPGQFVAPILPTIPGVYTVNFGGSLGDTDVDVETHVEEVQPVDTLAFPAAASPSSGAGAAWLVWLSIFIGLIGVGLGIAALRKTR